MQKHVHVEHSHIIYIEKCVSITGKCASDVQVLAAAVSCTAVILDATDTPKSLRQQCVL